MTAATTEVTAGETQTIVAARRLRDTKTVFIGVGRPSTAAILARMVHNPELILVYESGTIGAKPFHIPLSIGDGELAETADSIVSVPEMFNYWIGAGRIDVAFLGAAQIDRHANLNSTVIGDYDHPKTRLPGAGGAPEIAASCGEVIVIAPHAKRTFVEKLDFVTTVGHGDGPGAARAPRLPGSRADRGDHRSRRARARSADMRARADPDPPRGRGRQGARGDRLGAAGGRGPEDDRSADRRGALGAAGAARAMSAAYVLDAVRAPFGRYGGGLAQRTAGRPGRARGQGAARALAAARARARGRGPVRRRESGRRGQPQRGAHGVASERPAHERSRLDDQPPVRLEPGRGDAGQPRDRDRRGGRGAGRRGRVDEPRAVDPAQARAGVPVGASAASLEHAGVADGQPEHARPVDDLAGRERREAGGHLSRLARGPGRVRAAQPPERPGGVGKRVLRRVGGPGTRHRTRARREHPPRHLAREAGQAQAGVREGRHRDRRQLLALE